VRHHSFGFANKDKKDRKQEFSGHQRISQSIQVSTPQLKHPPVLKAIKVCLRSVLDCIIFWIASQISEICDLLTLTSPL
jgi:hypothetical protein